MSKPLFARWNNLLKSLNQRKNSPRHRPGFERLEDRTVPTILYSATPVNDILNSANIGAANNTDNIAASAGGNIHVAYGGNSVRVATSVNRGLSFRPSVLLDPVANAQVAVAAQGANNVYVAWTVGTSAFVSVSTDAGTTFSPPQTVTTTVGFGGGINLAVFGSNVYVQSSTGAGGVFRNSSNGIGAYVSTPATSRVYRHLDVDPTTGDVYNFGDDPTLYVSRSTDGGVTFSADATPSGSPPGQFFSATATSFGLLGKTAFVAGSSSTPVDEAARIDLLTDTSTTLPAFPAASTAQGRSLAADDLGDFVDTYDVTGNILYRVSQDLGATFTAPITVAAGSTSNVEINTAFQDILVVYQVGTNLFLNVYQNELLPRTFPALQAFRPLRYNYNRATDTYFGNVTLANLGTRETAESLFMILRKLPNGVTAVNADGFTPSGAPYFSLPGNGSVPAGSSVRVPIELHNALSQPLSTYFLGFLIEVTDTPDDSGVIDPSGYVYLDANKNGVRDAGEAGIAGVGIALSGLTNDGQEVSDFTTTNADGYYSFLVLPGTYTIRQLQQPAGYRDGPESLGTLGGDVGDDVFSNIVVLGEHGADYNFAEWFNHAPILLVEDRTMHANQALAFELSADDADGDSLTYKAHLADYSDLAHELDQQLGLRSARRYARNKLRLDYDEIWLVGNGKQRYLLLPSGDLYRYTTHRGTLETQELLANLPSAFYGDPNLLTSATAPLATIGVIDTRVVATPRQGFTGSLDIVASADDGVAKTREPFRIAVTNEAPVLAEFAVADQLPAGESLTLDLNAHDADGDALSFHANLTGGTGLAYELKQQLGLRATSNFSTNRLGLDEKWLTGSKRQKYLLLPNGELHHYRRGHAIGADTLVGTLTAEFYDDPSLLWDASEPTVTLQMSGNRLTITPRAGYRGQLTIDVSVTDGIAVTRQAYTINVA